MGVGGSDFTGRVAVVTGAASGMGQAAARLLVDLGAKVYALDIAEISVPVAKAVTVDMRDGASIEAAVAEIAQIGQERMPLAAE